MPTKPGRALRIETFDPARHSRDGFACGVPRLDNYLKLNAKKQQKGDAKMKEKEDEESKKAVLFDAPEEAYGFFSKVLKEKGLTLVPLKLYLKKGAFVCPFFYVNQLKLLETSVHPYDIERLEQNDRVCPTKFATGHATNSLRYFHGVL